MSKFKSTKMKNDILNRNLLFQRFIVYFEDPIWQIYTNNLKLQRLEFN